MSKKQKIEVDPAALEEAIDGMNAVCSDGRKQIKELFSKGLGVEFKKNHEFKQGQIWSHFGTNILIINPIGMLEGIKDDYKINLFGINLNSCGGYTSNMNEETYDHENWKFVANSLKEFYKK